MNRTLLGAFASLLLVSAGLFWWQGRAATDQGNDPPQLANPLVEQILPTESGAGLRGVAPPEVSEATREQRRFDRLDRNRDSKITRTEALMPRVAMFRKLDVDGNNLLSFEEWSVVTTIRFKGADANGDGTLNRAEFATTKPKRKMQPQCKCTAPKPQAVGKAGKVSPPPPLPVQAEPESDDVFNPAG
ncbi:MAG: hypothetical protein RLZZ136_657 [Pseudomonadota bacterium]